MTNSLLFVFRNTPHPPQSMLLDKTKLLKPGLINIDGRGGRRWLVECDIEGVVGKATPVFKYSQHFLSKIAGCQF